MNDPLDQKLSAHFKARKQAPATDNGFSARVLTALPAPQKSRRSASWFTWDSQWLVALIVTAILVCIPFGGHASGLNVISQSLVEVSNWLSMSSLAVALGLTAATLILLGDDEEVIPGWI